MNMKTLLLRWWHTFLSFLHSGEWYHQCGWVPRGPAVPSLCWPDEVCSQGWDVASCRTQATVVWQTAHDGGKMSFALSTTQSWYIWDFSSQLLAWWHCSYCVCFWSSRSSAYDIYFDFALNIIASFLFFWPILLFFVPENCNWIRNSLSLIKLRLCVCTNIWVLCLLSVVHEMRCQLS